MTEQSHPNVSYDVAVEAIRRSRRRARVGGRLLFPALLLFIWLANDYSGWWMLLGFPALLLLQVPGLVAYTQVCPRCGASLAVRRRFLRVLAPTCPGCGLPID